MWPVDWYLDLCFLKPFYLTYLGNIVCIIYGTGMFIHESEKRTRAYDFKFFENEEILKVTVSHVHRKYGNISESVPDSHYYYRPLIGSD